MQQQFFSDGIGKISVIGGVVRLDFMIYSPADTDANGRPRQVFSHQVLMGVDAFVRASQQCADSVRQLATRAQPVQTAPVQATPVQSAPAPTPPPPARATVPAAGQRIVPPPASTPPPIRPFP